MRFYFISDFYVIPLESNGQNQFKLSVYVILLKVIIVTKQLYRYLNITRVHLIQNLYIIKKIIRVQNAEGFRITIPSEVTCI